jgi:hypothetical protein
MFWFSEPRDPAQHRWLIIGVTLLSFAGLLLLALRRERIALFFGASWLVYPFIYYFVQHDVRYRDPILWLTLLPAGYVLSSASALLDFRHTSDPEARP